MLRFLFALIFIFESTVSHANYCTNCDRDKQGKIKRSYQAKKQFKAKYPCPATGEIKGACNGYVIDHIIPLKKGGLDHPKNMQWQTKDEAIKKDKWE